MRNNSIQIIQKSRKSIEFFLGYPLTIAALLLIGKILYSERNQIIPKLQHANIFLLILGILCISLFFLLKGLIWIFLLEKKGVVIPKQKLLFNYTLSETKRYIPGGIFAFITRVKTHKMSDIPPKQVLKNIAIESVILITSAFVVSFMGISFLLRMNWDLLTNYLFLMLLFIPLMIILGFLYFVIVKSQTKLSLISIFEKYIPLVLLGCLAWTLFGIGNFFIASSLINFNAYYFAIVTSLFVFAWLVGYISIILPMGLGARELVIVYALVSFTPAYLLSVIALFSRLSIIVGELIFLLISYLSYKIVLPRILKKIDLHIFLLSILVVLYSVYFSFISILRHNNFLTGRFDLGNMVQTIWNTYHGNIFQLTNPDGTNQIFRLGIHADFLLILLAPLYAVWEDPRILLIFQSIIIACGAFFVYAITIEILKNSEKITFSFLKKIALILGISYLLNFYIQEQTVFDFHAVSLSTTFLLATYLFFLKRKYGWFTLFLILSVLSKENIYLIAGLFGIALFFKKKKILGFLLAVISFGAFYLLMTEFIPEARGMEHFAISYLSYLGDKPTRIIANVFLKPYLLGPLVFNMQTLNYLYELFLTTGFLSLISPFALIFVLPDITINILSTNSNLRSYQFHYAAAIIPFVYIATIYGIKRLLYVKRLNISPKIILYYLAGATFYMTWNFGILPGVKGADYSPFLQYEKDKSFINDALAKIPAESSVAATNNIGAHLSQRKTIYVLPRGIEKAEYLVFYKDSIKLAKEYESNKKYEEISHKNDFWIFKKKY